MVGVIAPSDAVDREGVENSLKIIKSWGLRVKMGKHVYASVGDFAAGTPEERQGDLVEMIEDSEVRVIWSASGGYAATEVLPVFTRERMELLKRDPKWFIGYSDVCLLLNAVTSFKMVSVMGPTVWGLAEWDSETTEIMRKLLFGEPDNPLGPASKWSIEIEGEAQGKIVASNLETLIFSFGTRFDPLMYGSGPILLALEELDIEKSTLQRQIDVILSHKRASRITGIFVGRLVNIRELSYLEWGKNVTARELIVQRVKKWGKGKIPLAFNEDFGHGEWDYDDLSVDEMEKASRRFVAIPNGIEAKLVVKEGETRLEYLENVCSL